VKRPGSSEGTGEMEGVQKRFYTLQETQHVLACSRTTLYNLIKSGDLVRVYRGATPLVTATSVNTYADRVEADAAHKREVLDRQVSRILGTETRKPSRLRVAGR